MRSVAPGLLFAVLFTSAALAQAGVPARLNDTGQTTCYAGTIDSGVGTTSCTSTAWPGQDAASGRDALAGSGALTKIGGGRAGFDFSKISHAGAVLPASAQPGPAADDWACTRDNVSGLTWRIAGDTNLRWGAARLAAGAANAGDGTCGFRDWRLPTTDELLGIVDFGGASPAIDADYFPATEDGFYWTADTTSTRARVVNFSAGFIHLLRADAGAAVRLVRGGEDYGALVDNGDGTVTDPRSGLMWARCALGQSDTTRCSGDPSYLDWQDALRDARTRNTTNWKGHADWRLPNAKEMASLLGSPRLRPAIDAGVFRNAGSAAYWTSTTASQVPSMAWAVFQGEGDLFAKNKLTRAAVRLVRTATPAAGGAARDALFDDGFDASDDAPVSSPGSLPTISIDTGGASIDRDNYIAATMDISATADEPAWSGTLQIRGRGNSTWGMPKKPYKLKLDSKDKLLGMSKNKHWALLANYADKSLLRTTLGMRMGEGLGMAWSPDSRYARLVLNGQYEGVYQLIETIRVDSRRVDITEMEPGDVALPEVSGGYLFEIDQRRDCDWSLLIVTPHNVPICIDTPDEDDIVPQQHDYLAGYLQGTEEALHAPDFADPAVGYRAWLDTGSFIDWYLVNELAANVDAASFSSIWNYKDRDGKLMRGPLWDFDLGDGNAYYCACADPQGFWIRGGTWYDRMFLDPAFAAAVRARWDAVKAGLIDGLPAQVDLIAGELRGDAGDNFASWPILGDYVWPNVVVTGSWEGEVAYVKEWMRLRIEWLDAHL